MSIHKKDASSLRHPSISLNSHGACLNSLAAALCEEIESQGDDGKNKNNQGEGHDKWKSDLDGIRWTLGN
jgi:hypothetical protein